MGGGTRNNITEAIFTSGGRSSGTRPDISVDTSSLNELRARSILTEDSVIKNDLN